MGNRIATIQRQARELGRLRTGYTDHSGKKPRPVRSKTWIITSHAEHYVQAAAEVWGGKIETWQPLGNGAQQWRVVTNAISLDAILPPGDPLSQDYETWSKGGAQRRCDGMTESLSDQPCLCRAQYGDNFHETAPRDAVCKMTTRLNVILPEMPDIGAWRVETHSFYSANEITAAVDVLKGSIGDRALIPVRLRIEQRTRVSKGETKHFPVVAVELRGATAGQVLAGVAPSLVAGQPPASVQEGARPAIAAAAEPATPAEARPNDERDADYIQRAIEAHHADQVRAIYSEAVNAGHMHKLLADQLTTVGRSKSQSPEQSASDSTKLSADDHIKAAFAATTLDQLTAALDKAQADGHAPDLANAKDPVAAAFTARHKLLSTPEQPPPAAPAGPDRERLWAEIVTAASLEGFERIEDIERAFARRWDGDVPAEASATQLQTFLGELKGGTVRSPQAAAASPVVDSEVPF